ncbi:Hypothetical protein NGAL_HAMBI2427_55070 [Neorhizobium galegae bv. orientalis]|nr:Hypothetical protein NGAL_HAMBI2427_55070 [Neorhizobium galegae bv. orientalis]
MEPRHRSVHRFFMHQTLQGIEIDFVDDVFRGLDGLCGTDRPAAQQIQGAIMGDLEQPSPQVRRLVQFLKGNKKGVLNDILAIDHRSHEAGAIAI